MEEGTVTTSLGDDAFRLRSYQAEMVEESLRSNIIVVMDTGSGKTHIALSRTIAELEICEPDQIVWFLALTATLCEQQYEVFCKNVPAYGTKVLLGKDKYLGRSAEEHSNSSFYASSTLDALTHAFVKMKQLALIIFDEAHHCTLNHPANRIMANFYKPMLSANPSLRNRLPSILGLSASPVMRSKVTTSDLEQLEQSMDAVARTPKLHRSELLRHVHKPELIQIVHPTLSKTAGTPVLKYLQNAFQSYDMMKDPNIGDLLAKSRQGDSRSRALLEKTVSQNTTYCKKQLELLVNKGVATLEELGASPAEWYLQQCLSKYEALIHNHDKQLLDLSTKEKQHLAEIFRKIPSQMSSRNRNISLDNISAKVEMLIDALVAEATKDFTGLVFVEQRIWVAILAEILSTHPRTKELFNIGTFIGTSSSTSRKGNIADLAQSRNQETTLDDFRAGKKNLILTTSVLEEGIDVSSCHLVVCFERPKNLKSFVQRRGRARKQKSKYIIFVPESGASKSPQTWEMLEEQMKTQYLNDLREVKLAEDRKLTEEHEKAAQLLYRVPSTGALLTFDNASQHLHHFCSTLGSGPYVDQRPQFSFNEDMGGIEAEVTLPLSVDPTVRTATSSMTWKSERNATKDAAFQAYKNLHIAGLVSNNLLPIKEDQNANEDGLEVPTNTPSLIPVSPPLDPWADIAKSQQHERVYYRLLVTLDTLEDKVQMILMSPLGVPPVPQFPLYWNERQTFSVTISGLSSVELSEEELALARVVTRKVLYSVFHGRMPDQRDEFIWLLVPDEDGLTYEALQKWDTATSGLQEASFLIRENDPNISNWGLVTSRDDNAACFIKSIQPQETESQLQVYRVPKRRDFLHPFPATPQQQGKHTATLWIDAGNCTVSKLPARYSKFALFFPSIAAKIEMLMVVDTLRTTILQPLELQDSHLSLIKQAVTSSMAHSDDNYQRLEFLGDCILKLVASNHVMATHLTWHESYLSHKKDKIVSNSFLARATMAAGLDQFIFRKAFTGAKWSPRYLSPDENAPNYPSEKVLLSSKILADVIESLIGASYIAGGLPTAFTCIQTLLPLEPWSPLPTSTHILYEAAAADNQVSNLSSLERLIGYTFTKRSLLVEALTHASYNGPLNNVRSYERLEFLGDAVLDYIISKRLYAHEPELPHYTMHSIRTSMVNASFLTFRMLEMTLEEEETNTTTFEPEMVKRALWMYTRAATNTKLTSLVDIALEQHNASRDQILYALRHEKRYPWHLLALCDPPKHLSDIVESVIGAIYIDSQGDFSVVERFVKRLGIIDDLEYVLKEGVDCFHPKERLGLLAGNRAVEYRKVDKVNKVNEEEERGGGDVKGDGDGASGFLVQVRVGGQDVGGVVEGVRRLNAETVAAWRACAILEGTMDGDGDEVMGDEGEEMVGGEGVVEDEDDGDEFYDAEDGGVRLD